MAHMSDVSSQTGNLAEHVAEELSLKIDRQEWPAGRRLPSVRALAKQFEVSPYTVHGAIQLLAKRGVVKSRPRSGMFVRGNPKPALKQIVWSVCNERDWTRLSQHPGSGGDWAVRIGTFLEKELFEAGFSVTMIPPSSGEGVPLDQRLDRLGSTLCGGICFPQSGEWAFIEQMQRRGLPWVTINRPSRDLTCNYIAADNVHAGWRVGRLFVAAGFERVLLLVGNAVGGLSDSEKMGGVFQGCIESGAPINGIRLVHCQSIHEMDGYRATRNILEEGFRPQGVFTTGDFLAAGAIHALKDAGLRVPEDVGVIGATGLDRSAQLEPPLSVVAQPMEEMGRTAAKMLLEMIREGTRRYAPRRIPCSLILRESMKVSQEMRRKLAEDPDRDPLRDEPALSVMDAMEQTVLTIGDIL
jgi:DNA-binding LacI/PurR family transcriptional regulator